MPDFTICPYCNNKAELVGGAALYPHRHDLKLKMFWRCQPCGAHVGCHPATTTPLGRLADGHLRVAKSNAHRAFDPLWRESVFASRSAAYLWLAGELGLPVGECHIGWFDVEMCGRVRQVSIARWSAWIDERRQALR